MLIFGLQNAFTVSVIVIYYACENYLDLFIHHYLYISTYPHKSGTPSRWFSQQQQQQRYY